MLWNAVKGRATIVVHTNEPMAQGKSRVTRAVPINFKLRVSQNIYKVSGVRLRHPSREIATAVSAVLRALSLFAPVALLEAPAAIAETVAPSTLPAEIPAQPLAQALAAFAKQTNLQLVYLSGIVANH